MSATSIGLLNSYLIKPADKFKVTHEELVRIAADISGPEFLGPDVEWGASYGGPAATEMSVWISRRNDAGKWATWIFTAKDTG